MALRDAKHRENYSIVSSQFPTKNKSRSTIATYSKKKLNINNLYIYTHILVIITILKISIKKCN